MKDNPYRHKKTAELKEEEEKVNIELRDAAATVRYLEPNSSFSSVRRKRNQAMRNYEKAQEKMKRIREAESYFTEYGNENDKTPF